MATYTYLFMDLLTQAVNAELPCEKVAFGSILNGAGKWQGSIPLSDPNVQKMDPVDSTQVGRTGVFVDRDGVLVWGGVLWTRRYDSSSQLLELGAVEFLSYFAHRLLTQDKTFSEDQGQIAVDLLNFAQAQTGGNVHVSVPSTVTTGITRTQAWSSYEKAEIARSIQDLAAMEQGFDFGFDVAYNTAGTPSITFNLGYPRRGRTQDQTGLMWEFPGNISSYVWPEDGEQIAMTAYATGSGSGTSQLTASASDLTLLNAGWPLLEMVTSYTDANDQGTVQAHANADIAAHSSPVTLPVLTVRADEDPILGSYITGDDAIVEITDYRFPAPSTGGAGMRTTLRVHQYDVTPPSADEQPEQVVITMGSTPT